MNAIDLFSGAGGLTIALKNAGYDVVLANEINSRFAETHHYNFPDIPMIEKDIHDVTLNEIKNITNNAEIDLVIGGPPC